MGADVADAHAKSERGFVNQGGAPGGMSNQVDDQSTIEARSMIDNSMDKEENEDIVRAIMNDYTCEKCQEKDKIIENNEQSISDYIAYIQKQSLQRASGQSQVQERSSCSKKPSISTQTEAQDVQMGSKQISSTWNK